PSQHADRHPLGRQPRGDRPAEPPASPRHQGGCSSISHTTRLPDISQRSRATSVSMGRRPRHRQASPVPSVFPEWAWLRPSRAHPGGSAGASPSREEQERVEHWPKFFVAWAARTSILELDLIARTPREKKGCLMPRIIRSNALRLVVVFLISAATTSR